ncbi:serine/threonine-protein kinase [Glycomyces sp. NPDC047369]
MDAQEVIRWRPGETVLETFRIEEVVESGGMGFVYRARHLSWDVDLAVKTPRPDLAAAPGILDLLAQEAQAWTDLDPHPNVVGCNYVRRIGGYPVIFAEWVAGGDLASAVRAGRCRDLPEAIDVAIQVLRGVGHAHAAGLVHQDVKPSNIMYDGATARVTDFGTAKAKASASPAAQGDAATEYATLGGFTPQYCSPEQVGPDGRIGRASDLWSWALTVIEVIHGRRLWEWGWDGAASLDALRGDLPQGLRDLLAACLAPDPRQRIGSAEAERVLLDLYADCAGAPYPRSDRVPPSLKADGLSNKALSLWDLDERDRAIGLFERAKAIDPHNVRAVYNHGLILWGDGLVSDQTLLSELRATGESWEADYLAAMVHMERGDGVLAAKHLAEADRKRPGSHEIATARERCARLEPRGTLDVFGRLPGEVAAMAADRDGTHVAVAEQDGRVRIWDAFEGRVVGELPGAGRPVGVAIDDAARRVLVCYADTAVEQWRLTAGEAVHEGRSEGGTAVSLSPEGAFAAVGTLDGRVLVFDTGSRQQVAEYQAHEGRVTDLVLGQDAEVCVSASLGRREADVDHTVQQWWPLRRTRMRTLNVPDRLGGSDDGSGIAADGSVFLRIDYPNLVMLDMRRWGEPQQWDMRRLIGYRTLAVSGRAGWALLDPGTGDLEVLELDNRRCVRTFPKDWDLGAHRDAAAFSGDCGYAVLALRDRDATALVRLPMPVPGHLAPWSYAPPRPVADLAEEEQAFDRAIARIEAMTAAGDHRGAADAVREARAVPGHARHPLLRRASKAAGRHLKRTGLNGIWVEQELSDVMLTRGAFDVSASGRLIAFPSNVNDVQVFDLETLAETGSVSSPRNPAAELHFARGDRDLVIRYADGTVACFDTASFQPRFKVAGALPSDEGTTTLDLDGDLLTVGFGHGLAAVWSLETADCIATIRTGLGTIDGVTADAASRTVAVQLRTGDRRAAVEVRSIDTGKPVKTFANVDAHTEIRFASGVLLLAGMTRLTAWRPGSRRPLYRLERVKHASSARLSFADSRRLAVLGGVKGFVVWDAATGGLGFDGRTCGELADPFQHIDVAAVTPDGRYAVAADTMDETVDVWDLRAGRRIRTLHRHPVQVKTIVADDSFSTVVTGDYQGNVRVWGLDWDYGE